jgi:hypothetical protein
MGNDAVNRSVYWNQEEGVFTDKDPGWFKTRRQLLAELINLERTLFDTLGRDNGE